jgi:hypothetical protein
MQRAQARRRNLKGIGASLAELGQRRPLVVMGDLTIIASNARWPSRSRASASWAPGSS